MINESSFVFVVLFDILNDLGNIVKLPRVLHNILEDPECGRVVVTVANSLVEHVCKVDIALFLNSAFAVHFISTALCTERAEYGAGTEVVQMVEDGRNTQGAH